MVVHGPTLKFQEDFGKWLFSQRPAMQYKGKKIDIVCGSGQLKAKPLTCLRSTVFKKGQSLSKRFKGDTVSA